MKTFVIAGTYHEANYWIINDLGKRYPSNTSLTMSHYVYVSHADDLKGVRDPHGVFVGNWMGRPDILSIVEALMLASTHVNPALGKIYKDLQPKVRPTPKQPALHKVSGGYALAVDDAAMMLAKSIDQEVLNSILRKVNGGNLSA